MQIVTVGTKYQVVIPSEIRKKVKGILPGAKVVMKSLNKEAIVVTVNPQNWLERTRGLMNTAWRGRNIIKELERMRAEWEG